MARTRNPRNVILQDLRTVSRWMRWAISKFGGGASIYDTTLRRIRPRSHAEFIENDPDALREFAIAAVQAAEALRRIAQFAFDAADAAEGRKEAS
jgi:hypothetical protein